jgi:16S rRNA (cytosine967-C5)-methyltransferase
MAMAGVSAARNAAFSILLAVERGAGHSDDLLRGKAVSALSAADRHLATALVLGVLRWQIQLDLSLRSFLSRPNAKLDPEVLIALRLGAFQLLHLDRIPARAAIDESVELAKQAGHHHASRMVNAVLRKLAASIEHPLSVGTSLQGEQTRTSMEAKSTGQESPADSIARHTGSGPGHDITGRERVSSAESLVTGHDFSRADLGAKSMGALAPAASSLPAITAHPGWMVERWAAFFGAAPARAICIHNQWPPCLTVRVAAPEVEAELANAGVILEAGALLTAARTVVSGDIIATEAFRETRVRIQDEGSQVVAEIAALASPHNARTERILDACAAPGGKTLILAERNPQARIVACESNPKRLESLRERLAPFADRIDCRLADATTLSSESEFDVVLADVPCSGTGTLSRNPEIRHRLRLEDLPRQAERQRAILRSALRAARPGGRVVYSTCSLEPEENEHVVTAVLAQTEGATIVPAGAALDALRDRGILAEDAPERLRTCLTREGFLRLIPGAFHTDGFFIAIIETKH